MGPEVSHGEAKITREFKLEAVRLIRDLGVSYAQTSEDLKVHPTQLRNWVKHLLTIHSRRSTAKGQMKPEQLEIARLKRKVIELKAEREILKKPRPTCLLYTSPSPRDPKTSRMPSSA